MRLQRGKVTIISAHMPRESLWQDRAAKADLLVSGCFALLLSCLGTVSFDTG
jgi:hypothetical protein